MVEEPEKQPWKNPTPSAATYSREGSRQIGTSPRGAKGWCPTSGTLVPEMSTRMISPQNVWFGTLMGLMSGDPRVSQET